MDGWDHVPPEAAIPTPTVTGKSPVAVTDEKTDVVIDEEDISKFYNDTIKRIVERVGLQMPDKPAGNNTEKKQEEIKTEEIKPEEIKPEDTKPEEKVKPEKVTPVEPVSAEKKITIKRGETLMQLARNEYGDNCFWVYIYEENKQLIKSPDAVSEGTVLTIPPVTKYGIDKNNPESVKKARAKADQYTPKRSSEHYPRN
jgi:nucleoid-associated protein YgaU